MEKADSKAQAQRTQSEKLLGECVLQAGRTKWTDILAGKSTSCLRENKESPRWGQGRSEAHLQGQSPCECWMQQPSADWCACTNIPNPGWPHVLVWRDSPALLLLFQRSFWLVFPFILESILFGVINYMAALSNRTLCSLTLKIILPPNHPRVSFPLSSRRGFRSQVTHMSFRPDAISGSLSCV